MDTRFFLLDFVWYVCSRVLFIYIFVEHLLLSFLQGCWGMNIYDANNKHTCFNAFWNEIKFFLIRKLSQIYVKVIKSKTIKLKTIKYTYIILRNMNKFDLLVTNTINSWIRYNSIQSYKYSTHLLSHWYLELFVRV